MPGAGNHAGLTVRQLADAIANRTDGKLTARISGEDSRSIRRVAPLDSAGPEELSFLANARYRNQAAASAAGALVLGIADTDALFADGRRAGPVIACQAPYAWFALAAQLLNPEPPQMPGRAATAVIAADARVDASARIDDYAVIEAGATVAAGAWIGSHCHLARGARVGAQTRLYPGVRLMADCEIGARCIAHSGAVIGADGFGFAPFDGHYLKIPQTGRVVVGDDVEIGANTTIDRGTMGDTVIENGVKIDNQVQVAHNCRIGAHTVIAGCVGIAGSAIIGRHCQLGGAAMIHGHITICDGVIVSGGTLISRSISEAGFYSGVFPFMRNRDWERNAALVRHLGELRSRLRALESGARGAEDEKT